MFSLRILHQKQTLHLIINDFYIRFILTDKHGNFLDCGQSVLPPGFVEEGKINDPSNVLHILEQLLDAHKIRKITTYICVPNGQSVIRKVEVPADIPADAVKGFLYMQLGETLHLPMEDPIIEAVIVKEAEERDVLVLATREKQIQEYDQLLDKAKLHATVMDLSILASYRLFYHLNIVNEHDNILCLQTSPQSIQLSIFQGHEPLHVHHTTLDGTYERRLQRMEWYDTWKTVKNQDILEEHIFIVLQEINRLDNFYRFSLSSGTQQINKVIIDGDYPFLEELVEALSSRLEMQVHALPEKIFQTADGRHIPSEFYDCIGLSLKQEAHYVNRY